jgi:hypothetical protein
MKVIQRLVEKTNSVWTVWIGKPGGLLTQDVFLEIAMEEGIRDIKLTSGPLTRGGNSWNSSDHRWLDHRYKSLTEVDAGSPHEPANDPTRLVAVQGTVRMEFVLENPFSRDDVGTARAINKAPGMVGLESPEFGLHGSVPVRIPECSAH